MADCVHYNIGTAGHRRIVYLYDIWVLEHRVDFHFAHCVPLILNAVACDSLDGISLLVGRVLDQIDNTKPT